MILEWRGGGTAGGSGGSGEMGVSALAARILLNAARLAMLFQLGCSRSLDEQLSIEPVDFEDGGVDLLTQGVKMVFAQIEGNSLGF